MKQNEKNSKKAQELTNEELEQVNGGEVSIQDILQSTTAILMFPWTHKGQVPQVHQENKSDKGHVPCHIFLVSSESIFEIYLRDTRLISILQGNS